MIDYNKLYDMAREKFYDRLQTKDSFAMWAQKHTAIDHVNGALIIRKPINETHDEEIEFHDEYSFLATDGDNEGTDSSDFEALLFTALNAREGHSETEEIV